MLVIVFITFLSYAVAISLDLTPIANSYVNASRPLREELGRSRIVRNLVGRQSCADPESLVCQDQSCCPTGGACCSIDGTTVNGCCNQGYVCSFLDTTSRCLPSGGGSGSNNGNDSGCEDQTEVQCTDYDACCPVGNDCYVDSTQNLRCSATGSTTTEMSSTLVATLLSPAPLASTSSSSASPPPSSSSFPASLSPTPAGTAQPSMTLTTGDPNTLNVLLNCAPCGQSTCIFTSDSDLPNITYALIVGTPVYNCDAGNDSNVTDTIGGTITIAETWSTGASIGLDLGPLKIQANGGWSHSISISQEFDQAIAIGVGPGKQGVLVANVTYKRTSGSMQIDNGQGFPVVSNQPITTISYGPEIVLCGSQFNANISSPSDCTSQSNAHMWREKNALSTISLAPMIVIALISIPLVA